MELKRVKTKEENKYKNGKLYETTIVSYDINNKIDTIKTINHTKNIIELSKFGKDGNIIYHMSCDNFNNLREQYINYKNGKKVKYKILVDNILQFEQSWKYDEEGRLLKTENSKNYKRVYKYNDIGDIICDIEYGNIEDDENITKKTLYEYEYDENGNIIYIEKNYFDHTRKDIYDIFPHYHKKEIYEYIYDENDNKIEEYYRDSFNNESIKKYNEDCEVIYSMERKSTIPSSRNKILYETKVEYKYYE